MVWKVAASKQVLFVAAHPIHQAAFAEVEELTVERPLIFGVTIARLIETMHYDVRLGSSAPFTTGRRARLLGPDQRTLFHADRMAASCQQRT
jgi:hypothetical protein